MGPLSIFSVDVEDWFHILDLPETPQIAQWETYPSHLAKNFRKLLDLFDEYDVKVTCFFLGWVAQQFPDLIREATARGHEVASHGYAHMLCYEMTPEAFFQDVSKAKRIVEDILGEPIHGYRAPGFSVTEDTPWFFEKLAQAGFTYDSSVFPASRAHGGVRSRNYAPYAIETKYGSLIEFPITVARVFGRPMCFFGGGYLRLFPYAVLSRMGRKVLREGRPVVFYVHPREVEPGHPRLRMNLLRRFKSYVGLKTTEGKIRRLLQEFPTTTFEKYLSDPASAKVA
jgi:polysaccharide deacetylase family protein (PEP-CTERM system associated)